MRPGAPASWGCTCGYPCSASEDVDALALGEAHDRALGVLALAGPEPGTPGLARAVQRVDRRDLHPEDLLDGDLDLGLVRVGVHQERVLVGVEEPVALLTHDRRQKHVAVVLEEGAHWTASSVTVGLVRDGGATCWTAGSLAGWLVALPVCAPTNASNAPCVKTTSSLTSTS